MLPDSGNLLAQQYQEQFSDSSVAKEKERAIKDSSALKAIFEAVGVITEEECQHKHEVDDKIHAILYKHSRNDNETKEQYPLHLKMREAVNVGHENYQ